MKAKVYIETSIPSYLTARPSNDIRAMANQNATLEWWEDHRENFDLFISEFVLAEASLGHPEAAKRRMEALAGLPELSVPEDVMRLAGALITECPLPTKAEIDAFHIAVAAVNGMEYLLTWNSPISLMLLSDQKLRLSVEHMALSRRLFAPLKS